MSNVPSPTVTLEGDSPDAAHEAVSSSSSSFVPVEIQDAIQIIDEHKQFNKQILDYISSRSRQPGDYRIISVFGSQSTGKSTLLNHLFSTNFDVMDEVNRQQTTKGIWMAVSPGVSNSLPANAHVPPENILVMDVEGTDGRERGEDQDFERKAALFALSTSEVLIVNMWESQVGLYQGANMGLLKTVFEVNLSLFGKAKLQNNDHKVLLLFVIRDHLGVTPMESLAATITQDLLRIWEGLNKPADVAHLAFDDFFDLAFHTLSHKVLQNEKFLDDVRSLGNKFLDTSSESFLFKPNYHHDIPIEGWTMYAENCWDQIDHNKDLDLPTQQILVAKFKCDEVAAQCFEEFAKVSHELKNIAVTATQSTDPIDYKDTGLGFQDMKQSVLEDYDLGASKYNKSVYQQKRATLAEKIDSTLQDVFAIYAKHLVTTSLKAVSAGLSRKTRSGTFVEAMEKLKQSSAHDFSQSLALISLDGALDTRPFEKEYLAELEQLVSKQQIVELNSILSKALKKLNNGLSTCFVEELANPSELTWDHILEKFQALSKSALQKYETEEGDYDFRLGTLPSMNKRALKTFDFKSWELLDDLIHKYISKDNLLNILKDRFDDKFRYDENGVPRLYQNTKELEGSFSESKTHALKAFPILTVARLSDGTEVIPKYDVRDKKLKRQYETVREEKEAEEEDEDEWDSEDDENQRAFAELLSESEKAEVMAKFKREMDAKFVETKRSIMQHVTQIPYYIYIVILVLGWNEFMAILRNPFFFTLLIMLAGATYVMYSMNLLGPASIVVQRMANEALGLAKEKLREFVVDDHMQHGHNMKKMTTNDIELDNLSEEST
ncbi:Root hair defective 3 GTP-binding protein (RHD3) family protein [Clavispora lusitaniae]|uniref:Root hair defective 3 GTP-binding protein (RHD3) family protein n=1 Tax=Clavispora lusitaniae TaxID=36911 RepID=UPI00202C7B78|nr:Root hair defective 3 GTP-binding protein (RHD3) family protein [Clavispora lusitaniae]